MFVDRPACPKCKKFPFPVGVEIDEDGMVNWLHLSCDGKLDGSRMSVDALTDSGFLVLPEHAVIISIQAEQILHQVAKHSADLKAWSDSLSIRENVDELCTCVILDALHVFRCRRGYEEPTENAIVWFYANLPQKSALHAIADAMALGDKEVDKELRNHILEQFSAVPQLDELLKRASKFTRPPLQRYRT